MQFDAVAEWTSYCPRFLVDQFRLGVSAGTQQRADNIRAAVIFADIAGFTRITRYYQAKGDAGIEQLNGLISEYLGKLIDLVAAWGGDVENLYGDGLLAFWAMSEHDGDAVLHRALGCAAEIVKLHDHFALAPEIEVRIRVAATAGDLFALQVGGVRDHWMFLLAGDSLLEIGELLHRAQPGQIATSRGLRRCFSNIPEIGFSETFERFAGRTPTAPIFDQAFDTAALRNFLPLVVRERPMQSKSGWLAEFRSLSVLCVGMAHMHVRNPADLDLFQSAVWQVQDIVRQFGGITICVSMNDKGPLIMSTFGVPGAAHEDDAARAVLAAKNSLDALENSNVAARCTVASGPTYCGVVGNATRLNYVVMGDVVNRAFRLLARPDLPAMVCDDLTARSGQERIAFAPLKPAAPDLGGAVFVLSLDSTVKPRQRNTAVGREPEIERLRKHLDDLGAGRRPPVICVEGDPGIGKTCLIDHLHAMSEERFAVLRGEAEAVADGTTPYAAWLRIFSTLFVSISDASPEGLTSAVRVSLNRQNLPAENICFAKAVLPSLPLAPSGMAALAPDDVARTTRETLIGLLRDRLEGRRGVIIIEDVHWMDSASWALTVEAARDVAGLLLVLNSRPQGSDPHPGRRDLAMVAQVEDIRLQPLDTSMIEAVLMQALDCTSCDPDVIEAIEARAAGNPLFAIELVRALQDQDVLTIRNGECRLRERGTDLSSGRLPDSIQRTIVARVDKLSIEDQLTLKAACVIGRSFSVETLGSIVPGPVDPMALSDNLRRLCEFGLVTPVGKPEEADYQFAHAITRDVVYELMTLEQRRRLHEGIALLLEQGRDASEPPPPALFGLHWSRGGQPARALPYWETVGYAALGSGVYREAARALVAALECLSAIGDLPIDRVRESRIHRHLGDAYLQLGELAASERHLTAALACLGHVWPKTEFRTAAALLAQVALQASHNIVPPRASSGAVEERAEMAARIYVSFGHLLGHQAKVLRMMLSTFAAMNLFRRAGDSSGFSRAASLIALALHIGNMPRLAAYYMSNARRAPPGADQPHDQLMTNEHVALFLISNANLDQAETELRAMLVRAQEVNSYRRDMDATSLLIITLMAKGNAGGCAELLDRFEQKTEKSGDPQLRCWVRLERAAWALLAGDLRRADTCIGQASDLIADLAATEKLWTWGLDALTKLCMSHLEEAAGLARKVRDGLAGWRSLPFYAQDGIFGAAEVYLHALDAGSGFHPETKRLLQADAPAMMKRLKSYIAKYPVSQPRGLVLRARYHATLGQTEVAAGLFQRALAAATMQGRAYEQALAHAGLARLRAGSPEGIVHRNASLALLAVNDGSTALPKYAGVGAAAGA